MVAAPVDLRTKKAERFSPQARQGFWSKIEIKNPKIVVMSSTVFTKYNNQKEVTWQQDRLCLAIAKYKILGGKHFSYFSTRIRKDLVVEEGTIPSEEVSLPMDHPAKKATQVDFQ